MLENIVEAATECGIEKERIFIFDPVRARLPDGYQSWKSLLTHGEQDWVRFNGLEKCKNTTAALLFSSGTTGIPKAAMISHYNLITQHTLVNEQIELPWVVRITLTCTLIC
jgi:4-coumarate--CoA ligase